MKKSIIFLIILTFLFGCSSTASYKSATAGKIGCLPDDIEISNLKDDAWVATCRGKRFICSITQTSNRSAEFNCTPEAK
jgi:uncharacterized protein YceK